MPFINKKQAFEILDMMAAGTCKGSCRSTWLRNIQYALKTETNPLGLTAAEKKRMLKKVEEVKQSKSKKPANKTRKVDTKYSSRPSPPYPANEHCGETMKGNDGRMYTSVPDKNKVCRWKLKV